MIPENEIITRRRPRGEGAFDATEDSDFSAQVVKDAEADTEAYQPKSPPSSAIIFSNALQASSAKANTATLDEKISPKRKTSPMPRNDG